MPMPEAQRKNLAHDYFHQGAQVMARQDWNAARNRFRQAVALMPDSVLFRQSFIGASLKYFDEHPDEIEQNQRRVDEIRAEVQTLAKQQNWNAVIRRCDDGLFLDPNNISLTAQAGAAFLELELRDLAIFCYYRASKLDPDNPEYRRFLTRDDDDSAAGSPVPR